MQKPVINRLLSQLDPEGVYPVQIDGKPEVVKYFHIAAYDSNGNMVSLKLTNGVTKYKDLPELYVGKNIMPDSGNVPNRVLPDTIFQSEMFPYAVGSITVKTQDANGSPFVTVYSKTLPTEDTSEVITIPVDAAYFIVSNQSDVALRITDEQGNSYTPDADIVSMSSTEPMEILTILNKTSKLIILLPA